jgi:putative transposase
VRAGRQARCCQQHKIKINLLTKVPKSAQPWVSILVRTIFEQPGAASARAQHAHVVTAVEAKLPRAAERSAPPGPVIVTPSAAAERHKWRAWRDEWPGAPRGWSRGVSLSIWR